MREAVNREKAGQLYVIIAAHQQPIVRLPRNFAFILTCFSDTYRCHIIRVQPFSDLSISARMSSSRLISRADKNAKVKRARIDKLSAAESGSRCRHLSTLFLGIFLVRSLAWEPASSPFQTSRL
jgi:hypothetical protein